LDQGPADHRTVKICDLIISGGDGRSMARQPLAHECPDDPVQ